MGCVLGAFTHNRLSSNVLATMMEPSGGPSAVVLTVMLKSVTVKIDIFSKLPDLLLHSRQDANLCQARNR